MWVQACMRSMPWLVRLGLGLVWTVSMSSGRQPAWADQIASQTPVYSQSRELREDATLRAVAFNSDGVGVACGDRGAMLRTTDGGTTWVAIESGVDCSLFGVQWVASSRLVAVGGSLDRITRISRGVVLTSDDAGESWLHASDEELPTLRSIRWEDDLLLATGDWSDSLLTNRFVSRDRGRVWQAVGAQSGNGPQPPAAGDLMRWSAATLTPVAVRHACRVSDESICAVGDHGVILISRDRGRSWSSVRGEGRQTAVLVLAQDAGSVPWALVGSEAFESRSRVALLLSRIGGQGDMPGDLDAAHQAVIAMGASGVDALSRDESDPSAAAAQWIAIHRPAVLAVDSQLSPEVHDAFFQAATAAGVRRVVRYSMAGAGKTALHNEALLSRSGTLASDLQADAMLWVDPFRLRSTSIQLQSLYDAGAGGRGDSLLSGLPVAAGLQLAAPGPSASRRKLQIAQARMSESSRIRALAERSRTVAQFSDSLNRLLELTAKEDQFRLAWSVVLATSQSKHSLLGVAFHEAALERFATMFPDTSAGRWAFLRRDVMQSSVEWLRLRSSMSESFAALEQVPLAEPVAVSPFQIAGGVRQVSGIAPLVVPKPETINLNLKPNHQAEIDLAWEFHPLTLFAREAARQRSDRGLLQATDEESANLKRLTDSLHPWSDVLRRGGARSVQALRAAAPPRLDGSTDDQCWQIDTGQNRDDQDQIEPTVRVAYDDDYVYFAIQIPAEQIRADELAPHANTAPRDQDLSEVDRLQCWIDVDRDLMSAMQLQVSAAGRVHDAIDGQPGWQPTWYPSVRRDGQTLTFEMAVLRRDLVELPIAPGERWLVLATPTRAGQTAPSAVCPNPSDWYRVEFQP